MYFSVRSAEPIHCRNNNIIVVFTRISNDASAVSGTLSGRQCRSRISSSPLCSRAASGGPHPESLSGHNAEADRRHNGPSAWAYCCRVQSKYTFFTHNVRAVDVRAGVHFETSAADTTMVLLLYSPPRDSMKANITASTILENDGG